MAPKASKAKGKDKKPQSKGKVDDQSDDEPTQPPPMKKPKKEPIEDKEDIIGEKKDLDKLYQAMKYQAKKGNPHPLEKYNKLTSRQEKQEFLQKYLTNKKFDYVGLEQTSEANTSSTSKETEGWLSKYQIADFEKLPVDHPLLNDKLAGLAARAHSCKAWADKGEMEYFYTGAKLTEKGEQYVQSSKVKAKGAINKLLQESMIQGLSS